MTSSNGKPMIFGDHRFETSGTFAGMIGGSATATAGIDLKLGGMVAGDLVIETGATVHLTGMVGGRIRNGGGRVIAE